MSEERVVSLEDAERLSAYQAGDLDPAERARVEALLARSAAARAALARIQAMAGAAGGGAGGTLDESARRRVEERTVGAWRRERAARRTRRLLVAGGVAAVAAAAAVMLVVIPRRTPAPAPVAAAEAPAGQRLVALAPGAIAFAAPGTEIVPVQTGGRPVWRLAGEARLVVRRPEGQPPLVVSLPQGELVADRAEVDLATTATDARVAVRRGEVELRNAHGATTVWAGATATVTAAAAPKLGPPLRVVTLTRR